MGVTTAIRQTLIKKSAATRGPALASAYSHTPPYKMAKLEYLAYFCRRDDDNDDEMLPLMFGLDKKVRRTKRNALRHQREEIKSSRWLFDVYIYIYK